MKQKNIQKLIFFSIFMLSLVVNSVPPLMTTLQETFNMSVGVSSVIPFFRNIGNILISISGAFLIAIMGLRRSIIIGMLYEILSLVLFIFSNNSYLLIISMFFLGSAMGQVILVLISMFDHLDEQYQKYGLFHAFFGFGGIIGPLIISITLKNNINFKYPFIFYLAIILSLFLFIIIKRVPENIKYKAYNFSEASEVLKNKFIIILIIVFILYSGSEIGIITWGSNLFKDYFHFSKEYASIFLSLFWIMFTIGRIITDYLYKHMKIKVTIIFSFLAVLDIIFMFLLSKYSPYLFSLLGLMLGPIFPSTQKFLNSNLSHREVGLVAGMVSLSIGIGGALLTTLMGYFGDFSMAYSYLIPFVSLMIVAFLSWKVKYLKEIENK